MSPSPHCKVTGFTLIELLVTLAIMSLLAAVAYPSYSNYTRRSHISQALTQLNDLRLQQEQFYQENHTYLKTGTTDQCAVVPKANQYFSFSCSEVSAHQFTWVASSKHNGNLGDSDNFSYSIDNQGNQKTLVYDGESVDIDCWKISSHDC